MFTIWPATWAVWGSLKTTKPYACSRSWINTHMIQVANESGAQRFFYSSSACVYNGE